MNNSERARRLSQKEFFHKQVTNFGRSWSRCSSRYSCYVFEILEFLLQRDRLALILLSNTSGESNLKNIMPRMFQSIRLKLSLFVFLLLVLTTLLFSFATVKTLNRAILNQIISRAESLSRTSAAVTAYSLLSGDHLGMDQIVFKGKESNEDINYMAIVDTRMTVLVHSDIKKRGETLQSQSGNVIKESEDGTVIKEIVLGSDSYFEVSTPVIFKGKRLGAVFVGLNQSALSNSAADCPQPNPHDVWNYPYRRPPWYFYDVLFYH